MAALKKPVSLVDKVGFAVAAILTAYEGCLCQVSSLRPNAKNNGAGASAGLIEGPPAAGGRCDSKRRVFHQQRARDASFTHPDS